MHQALEVRADGDESNPHHASVWDLVELRTADELAYNRAIDALAKASTVLDSST